jgi:uncharacterized protein YodC (DUF2158 family)
MPWSDELKEEVAERVRSLSSLNNNRPIDLGLVDRNPAIWSGVQAAVDDGDATHETHRNAVRLVSGGPLMQYEGRDHEGNVLCYWTHNNRVMFGSFCEDDIVYVEQNEDLDN